MKIVLIGFMATGKSTIAPVLADKLGLDVVEMDDLIIQKSGLPSISDIFENRGESTFRELEAAVGHDLRDRDDVVISTGGGVVMNQALMDNLTADAEVIELTAPFDTILNRISPNLPRPLFQDTVEAKALYELRQPLYSKYATHHVSTVDQSVEQVVQTIIDKVQPS
jgi:shikimate kinase